MRSKNFASGPISARRRLRSTALRICRAAFSGDVSANRSNSSTKSSGPLPPIVMLGSTRAFRAMEVLMPPGWIVVAETPARSISSSILSASVWPRTANFEAL